MAESSPRPSVVPFIWYQDPKAAMAWLERAFGFETRLLVEGDDGQVIHSELGVGNGVVGVVGPGDGLAGSPRQHDGRYSQAVHVQLADGIDGHYARAKQGGAVITRQIADQPYGDRVYVCADPEGHTWSFGQTVKPMTAQEQAVATGHDIRTSLQESPHG